MVQGSSDQSALRASIVVPVYNAGEYIESSADSLLRQSIGTDQYEVIYVNDGSTDDSGEKLDKLAAAHPHVRVHHQENSGWPGKPRNVGVRLSRGAYVQFVDQDDSLGMEALERLCALGERNRADVVLGKVAGTMQAPSSVFAENVEVCTADDHPLMESLTPHKMFRRSFLLDNGIEFPEGRVRLEDQLFMARAYVAAERVSVLADYPCYYWMRREDRGNNSSARIGLSYFEDLRKVIHAVKAGTGPGEQRDKMLRRTYRVELLTHVSEARVLSGAPWVQERYETIRELVADEFAPGVAEGLAPLARLRAQLLEEGRLDALMALAERTKEIRPLAEVGRLRWRDGVLSAPLRLALRHADGSPVTLVERDGRLLLDPALLDGVPGLDEWDVGDPLRGAFGRLLLKDRQRPTGWFPDPKGLRVVVEDAGPGRKQVVVTGNLEIDPLVAAGGGPLERGVYDIQASFQLLGIGRSARITGGPPSAPTAAGTTRAGGTAAIPYWTAGGQLALDIGEFYQRMDSVRRRRWAARIPAQVRRPLGRVLRAVKRS
ncbi:glycosyltransferase [Streptomyces beijiangensis]|uniref:Glycosyltransferase n=1 Tax=Streptomyces beijiangensis TaxID=163361 RepID=A0A939JKP1_9ACTN|nr:glycosyltransferase [Streptomyces beijiangensis]MBO0515495.1 glycosyltransferase [Streptomyces beijiangensis]